MQRTSRGSAFGNSPKSFRDNSAHHSGMMTGPGIRPSSWRKSACPAVPNPIGRGCGTTPCRAATPHSSRVAIPNSLPTPRMGSMHRHACSWCENSPSLRLHPPASLSQKAPSGSAWVHEIKHDGYRLMARTDGNRVRLYTRRGYDWSGKYPWIVEALRSLRVRSIVVDGEAVWAGKDGRSDFDMLHFLPCP